MNIEADTIEKSLQIIEIYKVRWNIECFHRILKSGFHAEKSRLNTRDKLENLTTILSIVSWHLFWLYKLSREQADIPANEIFGEQEIKILLISSRKLKVTVPKEMTISMAVLGAVQQNFMQP